MNDRTITRPYDTALVVGRFQTFHLGHESLINTALSLADRVVLLIGSSQEHGTLMNPFSVITREKMIRSIFPGSEVMVSSISDVNAEKIVDEIWGNHVLSNVKQLIRKAPDVYLHGQEAHHINWFRASNNLINETKHMAEVIVARERINISASTLRDYMFKDEFEKWAKYVNPKLHKHYSDLRTELLLAPGMKELVHEHLKFRQPAWSDTK